MFDTALFIQRHHLHLPRRMQEQEFTPQGRRAPSVSARPFTWFRNVTLANGAVIKLHWSAANDGHDYLSAEASLPTVLRGTNVWPLESEADAGQAVNLTAQAVSEAAGVDFDAWEANIGRLDVCHQWQLGEEEVYARLNVLQRAHAPRMTRYPVDEGTIYFQNKSQRFAIYAKHAQVKRLLREGKATDEHLRAAVGVFRVERRYLGRDSCRKLAGDLGLPDRRAASLLLESVADIALKEMMMVLKLDEAWESGDSRLALLREQYGITQKYQRLAGFLTLCDEHGPDSLVALGMNEKTYKRQRKEVEKAGAWLAAPLRRTLPPLRLVRETSESLRFVA